MKISIKFISILIFVFFFSTISTIAVSPFLHLQLEINSNTNVEENEKLTYTFKERENDLKIFKETNLLSQESIIIESKEDFERLGIPGEGTEDKPYLIQYMNISSSSKRLIDIQNIDLHVLIQNNRLNGLSAGLYGIYLSNVSKIIISNNVIQNNTYNGIVIAKGNKIEIINNWIFNNGFSGITIHDANEISIHNNYIFRNHERGLWLSSNVKNSKINRNSLRDNSDYGIQIEYEKYIEPGDPFFQYSPSISSNNLIKQNSFINNNIYSNKSQVGDFGEFNFFEENHYSEWIGPDSNNDNRVDIPYNISSTFSNASDGNALTSPTIDLMILTPIFLYPIGSENYVGTVNIQWTPSLDLEDNPIHYNLYYSIDNGQTWESFGVQISGTSFEWDISSFSEGTTVKLKIEASNGETLSASFISESFFLNKPDLIIFMESIVESILFQIFFIIFLGVILLSLIWLRYRSRISDQGGLTNFIYSFKENQVRKLYHKLIIGLENAKAELLSQSDSFTHLDTGDYAVIGNVFPPDIQHEMKSSIKGRTVLMLIEIAYQPITNSNTSYLAKILDIPQQTASDEIKKLNELEYLRPFVSKKTLIDTRKKSYSLTQKGVVLLHLLKESLTVTITKMQKERFHEEIEEIDLNNNEN
ncbi:MAG: right-handed parallel beta-helix repeat-containing protein [Candidatus Hodarchaeales archaeon]